VVSGKEHVPVGQLIETCTEKCPNISQEIEDKPSSICNGVENVECEESLSHNTEEATFSGNSEVFVTRKKRGILQSINVTRVTHLTPKCKKMYRKIAEWGRKTARMHHKIKSLQVRLSSAEKVANCPRFSKLMEYVNDTTYTFIMSQIKNQNLQPRARRFTIDEKILSRASGKGYRLLSTIFSLPSRRTLTNLLKKIQFRPGINEQIVRSLKLTVSKLKNPSDKLCAIVFDELALSPLLSYNRSVDCVDGLEDLGNRRTPHIAGLCPRIV
jgi:hypothetical protein